MQTKIKIERRVESTISLILMFLSKILRLKLIRKMKAYQALQPTSGIGAAGIRSYVRPVILPESTKNINCVEDVASALGA